MIPSCDAAAGLPCWVDVDLDAIAHNVQALRRWVGPRTRLAAVVKADGYGIGAPAIAEIALQHGASWLAVARVHEAVALRRSGFRAPILVMNRTDPRECDEAVSFDLTVTVDDSDVAGRLAGAAHDRNRRASVHVKVDTGLHRFGLAPSEARRLVEHMAAHSRLDIGGLFTHFASADASDLSFTLEQLAIFERTSADLAAAGHRFALRHAANSAATLAVRASHLDLVRVGLSILGVSPLETAPPPGLDLRPALAFRARIARVCEVGPGESVGYGQTWQADRATRVGLVTAGYADGVSRRASNRGAVLVNGRKVPIIGRVSMDQTTIDITTVPTARAGQEVTFFGADGGTEISLWEFARAADGIPHDALTGIGGRVARLYHGLSAAPRLIRLNGSIALH